MDVQKNALVSPCGAYRYWLSREWSSKPNLPFVMLNPSTADATVDDPTIRRCMGFAKREGYGGIFVYNLFALRATNPDELRKVRDPVGPDNDQWLDGLFRDAVRDSLPIIAAWGVHGRLNDRASRVKRRAAERGVTFSCLGQTKDGHPKHPLYLAGDAPVLSLAA